MSSNSVLVLLLLGLSCVSAASPSDDFYDIVQWNEGSLTNPDKDLPFALRVYSPANTTETFGVVVFISGFSGDCPTSFYDTTLKRLASHGVIVVGADKLQKINFTQEVIELEQTFAWLQANLSANILSHGATAVPDFDLLMMAGHSAGCHTVTQFLTQHCSGVRGVVLIDPVDGADPLGIINDFIIHPPNPVNFSTPTLQFETGYDPVPKSFGLPACAPKNLSNDRFFNAWQGPIWQINGTLYAHDDVMDEFARGLAGIICGNDASLTADDRQLWRETVGDLAGAFVRGILYGEVENFDDLEDTYRIPVDNILKQDYHGFDKYSLGGGFCKNL